MNRRNKAVTPTPKGAEAAKGIVLYPWQMDTVLPAHRWLLKYTKLFVMRTVVSPMRSVAPGRVAVSTPQEEEMAQRVEERDKKRMPLCNGADRGSKFASV